MTVQELHNKAIEYADLAFIKKFNGKLNVAIELFSKAFQLEKEAALQAQNENIGEPTISVLLKSAASLAMNSDNFNDAEKLICLALYGSPPIEIAEELRNLLEELYFQRHLKLQGISISPTELQLVIAGRGIGYGMAKSELVFDKLNTFEKLTLRTAERKTGKPFRSKGDVSKLIKMNFQPYLSVPRAASFAFTIRLGVPADQLKLEGFENSIEIIEDLVDNINLVNSGSYEELSNKITDESYFKNFISLSKELAPDGEEVNLVGLTILREGAPKDVQFTRIRSDIQTNIFEDTQSKQDKDNKIELIGRLYAANEEQSNIKLKVEGTGNYSISVPEGLGDIVKKYWGEQVKIKGTEIRPRVVKLTDLDPA
ncbi:MAG: hypothetical protein Q8S11_17895 [Daejeonella sp.]|uniref:hypothetical protein n=1 Tax=Daejeonella sp. TaxID=2805397 RepID=UPI0027343D31|nr:hypothetical protein [Daejeonella sp.]MDP3470219.1 hypothetical protein [Daejeonella sp.]